MDFSQTERLHGAFSNLETIIFRLYLGSTPHPVIVEMKVYRDSLLKMVHNPGGDWNPGWGVDLSYIFIFFSVTCGCFGW